MFALDDADAVAGNVIPEPDVDGVAPPTPIVVDAVILVPSDVTPDIPPKAPALLYCNCVLEPPGEALAVAQDSVPEPFVTKAWLEVPSVAGSVHVTLDATVAGDWKATQLEESESANRKSLCAFNVTLELNTFVPENVLVPEKILPPENVLVVPEEFMLPEITAAPEMVFVPLIRVPPAKVNASPEAPVWNSFR